MLDLLEYRKFNAYAEAEHGRDTLFRLFGGRCQGCGSSLLAGGNWSPVPWIGPRGQAVVERLYPLLDPQNLLNQRLLCGGCGEHQEDDLIRPLDVERAYSFNSRLIRNQLHRVSPGHHSLPAGRHYYGTAYEALRAGLGVPLTADLTAAYDLGESYGAYHRIPWAPVCAALNEAVGAVDEGPLSTAELVDVVLPTAYEAAVVLAGYAGRWTSVLVHGESGAGLLAAIRRDRGAPSEAAPYLYLDGPLASGVRDLPFAWLRPQERTLADMINLVTWCDQILATELIDAAFCVSRYQDLPRITRIQSAAPASLFDFLAALQPQGEGAPALPKAAFIERNRRVAGNLEGAAAEALIRQYHSATDYVLFLREEIQAVRARLRASLDPLQQALGAAASGR